MGDDDTTTRKKNIAPPANPLPKTPGGVRAGQKAVAAELTPEPFSRLRDGRTAALSSRPSRGRGGGGGGNEVAATSRRPRSITKIYAYVKIRLEIFSERVVPK